MSRNDIYIDTVHRNPLKTSQKLIVMTYRNVLMLHEDFTSSSTRRKLARIMKKLRHFLEFEIKTAIILNESAAIRNSTSKTFKLLD